MAILETNELTKDFGGLRALNKVNLSIAEQEILGLIGPNGAGKTTFVNCVAGTYAPSAGRVYFFGDEVTGSSASKMCHRGLARTFQIPHPFLHLTVMENVLAGAMFGSAGHDSRSPVDVARELLDFVELPVREDAPADQLNAAQLKRLDLARALACQPKLLLLDELAAGLTPAELGDMMEIIRTIRERGVTILMIEHIMDVIMGLCDRIFVIHYGTEIAQGDPQHVASNPDVLDAYLGVDDELLGSHLADER